MNPFTAFFALPKVTILNSNLNKLKEIVITAHSNSHSSVCRKCAALCFLTHDYRTVSIREPDHIKKKVWLILKKKRYWCHNCNSVHSESIPGISHRGRSSERFRRWVLETALRASSLALAAKTCRVSMWFIFHYFHRMLRTKLREYQNPWPQFIGIDEHSFKRNKSNGDVEYVTVFVDHINKRMRAIVLGRNKVTLLQAIKNIDGSHNVKAVSIDLSGNYREFVKEAFPKASIVADKFHVMRLFGRLITRERIDALGDKRKTEVSQLLKCSQKKMTRSLSEKLARLLEPHPKLYEAYRYKVLMYNIYRKTTKALARECYIKMLDEMARSKNPNVASLRETLLSWMKEILNYFDYKITNARTEGFNNKCKQVKRRGYGYTKFENYARRCLGESLLHRGA